MENTPGDLKTRLAEVQESLVNVSIQYQNMKDRQSLKTLGVTTGIALLFIGVTLGHSWVMRIGFVIAAALLIFSSIYGIKKVDPARMRELESRIANMQDQITAIKKALKLQHAERNKK